MNALLASVFLHFCYSTRRQTSHTMARYLMCICLFFSIAVSALQSNVDYNILGTTAAGWDSVRDLFEENFVLGRDIGASLAAYCQGQLVVDLQGGWFDQSRKIPYDYDTLQLVFSTSKCLVAVAVGLCVQQGLLNYSDRVTQYWSEYGQNGKENTTVADI